MYISYNPCREMTDILQQQLSQFLCTEQMPIKKTSGSSLLITYSPTAYWMHNSSQSLQAAISKGSEAEHDSNNPFSPPLRV